MKNIILIDKFSRINISAPPYRKNKPSRCTEYFPAPIRTGSGVKFSRMAVTIVTNKRSSMQLVYPLVEIDRYHQYLHSPSNKQKIDSGTRNQSISSAPKTEEAEYATPLPWPQDRPPDIQRLEQRNIHSNLSTQYFPPSNFITFESGKEGTAHTIIPSPPIAHQT